MRFALRPTRAVRGNNGRGSLSFGRWRASLTVLLVACSFWSEIRASSGDVVGEINSRGATSGVGIGVEADVGEEDALVMGQDGVLRKRGSLSKLEAFIAGLCDSKEPCFLEKIEFDAIRALHRQLDDDKDGDVDISESDDFLRGELQYEGGSSATRQQAFHQNDKLISVDDLWRAWIRSEVHNWTVEETGEWLMGNVDLPQYVDTFVTYQVNGSLLPTLATNSRFMTDVLSIRDPIHRQKIALKAMDVVLFGAPKVERQHIWKETILLFLLFVTVACYLYAYRENKRSQKQLKRMMHDMEGLSKAEKALQALQNKQKDLTVAKEEDEKAETKRRTDLEKKIRREITQKCDLGPDSEFTLEEQVSRLKEELAIMKSEWERAEQELTDKCWFAPPELQNWLQLSFEIELKYFNAKKAAAQSQLAQAKEACEKLKKRRSNLIGSFVSAHGKNIDDVDTTILQAKAALVEVTNDLQERMQRWQAIERLCKCSIINNPGYNYLEMMMRGNDSYGYAPSVGSRMNGSHQGDDDDDTSSVYAQSVASGMNGISGPGRLFRRKRSVHSGLSLEGSTANGGIHPSNTQIGFDVLCTPHVRGVVPNGGDALMHANSSFSHSKSSNALPNAPGVGPRRSPSAALLDQLGRDDDGSDEHSVGSMTGEDEFPPSGLRRSGRNKAVGSVDDDVAAADAASAAHSGSVWFSAGGGGGPGPAAPRPMSMSSTGMTRRLRMASNKSLSHDAAAGLDPSLSSSGAGPAVSFLHGRDAVSQSPSKSHSESALDARSRGPGSSSTGSPTVSHRLPPSGLSRSPPHPQQQHQTTPPSLASGAGDSGSTENLVPDDHKTQPGISESDQQKATRRSKKSLFFSKLAPGRHRKSSPPPGKT